jgi:pyridoxamine 5'-phosphate oxidase family protein
MIRHERVSGRGDRIPQESQLLGRLATFGPDGQPPVVPVSRSATTRSCTRIEIGGHDFARHKKYKDVQHNPKVAFLVDDMVSVDPWRPRGIEVRGEAEVLTSGGEALGPGFAPDMFRIRPQRIVSWGIEGNMVPGSRSVS